MCPNFNKLVVHAAANCFTFPANKDKIPTWYKPPKLKRALEQMPKVGIVPKHQVLDNQASVAYKKVIGDSDMTYELVSPDNQ